MTSLYKTNPIKTEDESCQTLNPIQHMRHTELTYISKPKSLSGQSVSVQCGAPMLLRDEKEINHI